MYIISIKSRSLEKKQVQDDDDVMRDKDEPSRKKEVWRPPLGSRFVDLGEDLRVFEHVVFLPSPAQPPGRR
jgi:hypothetical protein